MSEFSQIGGVEAAKRLVEFLSSPEPRVQSGALELIGVFIKGACHMRRRAEDIIEANFYLSVQIRQWRQCGNKQICIKRH
jgi:hypothetical protein